MRLGCVLGVQRERGPTETGGGLAERRVPRELERWVHGTELVDPSYGSLDQGARLMKGNAFEARPTRLPSAEVVARAPQAQVFLSDFETIACLDQHPQALDNRRRRLVWMQEPTLSLPSAPSDAASELMELTQPEALGVLDHHEVHLWNVDPYLDDRAPHQDGGSAIHEAPHRPPALIRGLSPVNDHHIVISDHGADGAAHRLDPRDARTPVLINARAHDEGATTPTHFGGNPLDDLRSTRCSHEASLDSHRSRRPASEPADPQLST